MDDFIALLTYHLNDGRKTPASSGYRPTIKFPFSEMQTSGRQIFIDKEFAQAGDTVKASIKLGSPHLFTRSLKVDMAFDFREGPHIIGTGKILEIINQELNSN